MTSFIAAGGSGRSTSVIPAVPAASSVTTIAFIQHLPCRVLAFLHEPIAGRGKVFKPRPRAMNLRPRYPRRGRAGETDPEYVRTAVRSAWGAFGGGVSGRACDSETAVPRHIDLTFEDNVARPFERVGHRDVFDVGAGTYAWDVVHGEYTGAFGEDVIDVALASMAWQNADIGDDPVVVVVCGDDESDRLAIGERRDPPPIAWTRIREELTVVLLGRDLLGSVPFERFARVRVQRVL